MPVKKFLWGLCAALVAAVWLPNLLTKGMFMDGVINAVVAENLANGIGSFYHLKDYNFPENAYTGHPPLAFQLQAFFFQMFGAAHYIERVYSLLCLIVQMFLLRQMWVLLRTNSETASSAWPLLFFICSPIVIWCYSNNLLENTMSMFTTASVVWVLRSAAGKNTWWLSAFVSGLLLMAGLLCKGPVALFVVVAPLLLLGHRKMAWGYSGIMLLTSVMSGMLLYAADADFLSMWLNYYLEQLAPAIYQPEAKWWLRLSIWGLLLLYTLPLLLLWAIAAKWGKSENKEHRLAIPFIVLGLCGSLPLAISHKQSAFYLLPAMPFFALGVALWCAKFYNNLLARIPQAICQIGTGLCGAVVMVSLFFCINKKDKVMRDKELIADAEEIARLTAGNPINTDWSLSEEWHFRAYLYRYHKIVVCFPDKPCESAWLLLRNRDNPPNSVKVYSGHSFSLYSTL